MKYELFTDFSWALTRLRLGERVYREGWNGKGQWIGLQTPDRYSKMELPYLYINTVGDKLVPWVASQTDILATDWRVVVEPNVEQP